MVFYKSEFRVNSQNYWLSAARYQDGAAILCISKPNFQQASIVKDFPVSFISTIAKDTNRKGVFIVTVREGNGLNVPITVYRLDVTNPNRPNVIATGRSPSSGQQTTARRSPTPVQTYSDTRALGMAQFLQGKQELISAQEKLQLAAKGQYETINIPKTDFLDKKITDRKGSGCIPLLPCSDDKKISYADYLQLKLKVNGQAQTHKNSLKVYQEIENYRRRLESDKRLGGQDSANRISSIFKEANRKAERQLQQRQGQVFSLGNISALTVDSFLESLKLVVAGAKFDWDIAPAIIRVYVAARSRGSLTVSQAENIVQSFQSRGISPEGLKRRADYLKEMSDIMPQAIEAFKDKDIKKQQNLIIQTYNETASLVKSENLLTKGTAIYTGFVKLQESNEKLKNLENTLNELTKTKLIDERDKSYIEGSIYSAQWDYFSSYISLFESIAKSFGADKAKQFEYWEESRKIAESIKTGLSNARDNLAELAVRDDYQRLVTQYEKNQIIISASSPAIDSIADEIGKYLLKARTDVVTRRPDGTIAVSINGVVFPP